MFQKTHQRLMMRLMLRCEVWTSLWLCLFKSDYVFGVRFDLELI